MSDIPMDVNPTEGEELEFVEELSSVFEGDDQQDRLDEVSDGQQSIGNTDSQASDSSIRYIPDIEYIKDGHAKHKLDIYLPTTPSIPVPVVIHIHGGGWKRGDRKYGFYGAPTMCKGYAQSGILAVAPSYRLGRTPHHLEDVCQAIKWVYHNIEKYDGDPKRIFLSGHSAGGNIVTLLVCRDYFSPLGLPSDLIQGVVAISGVYTLFRPMGGCGAWKNGLFMKRYVEPTFGREAVTIVHNSPSLLLRLAKGMNIPEINKACPIWSWITNSKTEEPNFSHIMPKYVPRIVVISASWDLGLEHDAKSFVELLKEHGVEVNYHVIPETNHASVCWSPLTYKVATNFVRSISEGSGVQVFSY